MALRPVSFQAVSRELVGHPCPPQPHPHQAPELGLWESSGIPAGGHSVEVALRALWVVYMLVITLLTPCPVGSACLSSHHCPIRLEMPPVSRWAQLGLIAGHLYCISSRPAPLSDKAQATACRLQEELEKLRTAGPLQSSGEEATQLKVETKAWALLQGCGHS